MAFNSKYTTSDSTKPGRGDRIVTQFARDATNDDTLTDESESRNGRPMKGGVDNISPMITGGKANQE